MISVALLVCGWTALQSPPEMSDAELLARAAEAFRTGLTMTSSPDDAAKGFAAAATDYETLLARGYRSGDLLGNLGNAHLLAGDLPRALRAYHQGLALAPTNRRLEAALDFARQQVVTNNPHSSVTGHWLPLLPAWLAMTLAAASYLVIWLSLALSWMVTRHTWLILTGIAGAVALVAAISLSKPYSDHRANLPRPLLIIAEDNVIVRTGDGDLYPQRDQALLNRGAEVRLLHQRGHWLQVKLANSAIGWIRRSACLCVDANLPPAA